MKNFRIWRNICTAAVLAGSLFCLYQFLVKNYSVFWTALVFTLIFAVIAVGFYTAIKRYGIRTEFDISRVLGKDAKDALSYGDIGILVYNDDYVVTWASSYFQDHHINIENKKVTSWISDISKIFDEEVDTVIGKKDSQVYEIIRKQDAQVLFVKNITKLYTYEKKVRDNEVVIGIMQLDNYMEYQSYEDEEIIANINMHLRTPLITWAKENGMFIRRMRSDRFLVILNHKIFKRVKSNNFSILQLIKDEAAKLDVSITLSMAFAYGTEDFITLDNMVSELIELAQSRGGDQAAIRKSGGQVVFIGGNSELSSQRSKVRVRIMAQSIQETMKESQKVFIAGHVNSDFDCMGAALSVYNWAKALNKTAYIVLKDVPRDKQLQNLMEYYQIENKDKIKFITPGEARERINKDKDLLIMVDHSVPAISSAADFVNDVEKVIVIDHHRRGENFVSHPVLTYIESTASSTCELIVELLQNTPNHVPIYENDATIMYLGILVDTNRFTMHTSARTFEAVAALRNWGANSQIAEKALCEDLDLFKKKNALVSKGVLYDDRFMITDSIKPLNRTLMAQVSDAMLKIKGAQASFTIAPNMDAPENIAISARSDGSFNVQKIMEKLGGGGHFAASATEIKNADVNEVKDRLLEVLKEEIANESHPA